VRIAECGKSSIGMRQSSIVNRNRAIVQSCNRQSSIVNRQSSIIMDELFIKLPETTVYGRRAGDLGAPLLLGLHGWSRRNGWHTWEPLMQPLAAAGYCVVSVDMPGWGASPPLDERPLSGARAAALVFAIMDGLAKETAVLMGKSWGGGVAITAALDRPARVAALILTAPAFTAPERLPALAPPVLLAWAEDDPMIPFAQAEVYKTAVADLTFVPYPTGGHSAAPKNAADFAPRALAFLARHAAVNPIQSAQPAKRQPRIGANAANTKTAN
jgi:pimeloyl-ACP methyl ester carboxylesterase